jgi:hypothetical protein
LAIGPVQRRLAAILAADVAGYSRLVGTDEVGTHERLRAHLGELINRTSCVANEGCSDRISLPAVLMRRNINQTAEKPENVTTPRTGDPGSHNHREFGEYR